MLSLALLVCGLGVADSVNPSTVVPALWLAGGSRRASLASYTLGVFGSYLVGGLVLLLGPGSDLIRAFRHLSGPLEHAIELGGGLLVVAIGVTIWRARSAEAGTSRAHRPRSRASAFALGTGIMAVELPTAFTYFAAISAIIAARAPVTVGVALVVAYNALFIAPLLGLLALSRRPGTRARGAIARLEAGIRRIGQAVLAALAGAGGTALLALGLRGLLA